MTKCFRIIVCLIVMSAFAVIMSIRIENRQLSDIMAIKSYDDVKIYYANLVVFEKELRVGSGTYKAVYLRPEFPSLPSGCRVLIFNCLGDCVDKTADISMAKKFKVRWQL